MINENDVKNVNNILNMFKEEYEIILTEENSATFIAHICAAYARLNTGTIVEELPQEVAKQLERLKTYQLSLEILDKIIKVTDNPIIEEEKVISYSYK